MKSKRNNTFFIVQTALIGAFYAALTYAIAPLSFGAQQLRVAEALTVLPVITPAAVPGLAIGCFIANLSGPYGIVDIVCGTLATLLAALCTRATRNVRFKKLPLLSLLFPVIFNSVIIGLELTFFLPEGASLTGFLICAGGVAIGEAVSCYAFGLPLFAVLDRMNIKTR